MTFRALLLGLMLALPIAALGYFNDWILCQAFVASDLIPVSVYGLLVVGLILGNPLLALVRRAQLSGAEWAVVASMMLMGCIVPGPAMMWQFSAGIVSQQAICDANPAHRQAQYIKYFPPAMITQVHTDEQLEAYRQAVASARSQDDPVKRADMLKKADEKYDEQAKAGIATVYGGFKSGLGTGSLEDPIKGSIPWNQVPWWAWKKTLSFWLPLLGLFFIATICGSVVIHRQWAHRERLRYPVADFATELLNGAGDGHWASIFHRPRFWIGFGIAFGIVMVNSYFTWSSGQGIEIPMKVDISGIAQKWPKITAAPGSWAWLGPTLWFSVLGFSYFVSSEVSFSLGISNIVFVPLFVLLLTQANINFGGDYMEGGNLGWQLFGSYLGAGLMILYIGRRFYGSLIVRTVGIAKGEPITPGVVWAARIGLLAAAAMVVVLSLSLKLDPIIAILVLVLIGLLFLIVTRINVETGLFFIQPSWQPIGVLLGLLGAKALGPNVLAIVAMLCVAITLDPRLALMPLVTNALRFGENQGVAIGGLGRWMIVGVLVCLVVGVVFTIYTQYDFKGSGYSDWWSTQPTDLIARNAQKFDPAATAQVSGVNMADWKPVQEMNWSWSTITTNRKFLMAVGIGLTLFVGVSLLRLRFQWWPIHPVLFLIWGTFPIYVFASSFLLGWLIKSAITKFGGSQSYRNNKPIFVGLVAGEFVAGIVWMTVAWIEYATTGTPGIGIRVHP